MAFTDHSEALTVPEHLSDLSADEYRKLIDDVVAGDGEALATLLGVTEHTTVTAP